MILEDSIFPLYSAFAGAFSSLPDLKGKGEMQILYGGGHGAIQDFQTAQKVMAKLYEVSCDGVRPAMIYILQNKCEVVPYVGDRTMTVEWNNAANAATVTFDLTRRPSRKAIYPVVEEILSRGPNADYSFVKFWDEAGNLVEIDQIIYEFMDGQSSEVKSLVRAVRLGQKVSLSPEIFATAVRLLMEGKRSDYLALEFAGLI